MNPGSGFRPLLRAALLVWLWLLFRVLSPPSSSSTCCLTDN
jgi:hypothetical protein